MDIQASKIKHLRLDINIQEVYKKLLDLKFEITSDAQIGVNDPTGKYWIRYRLHITFYDVKPENEIVGYLGECTGIISELSNRESDKKDLQKFIDTVNLNADIKITDELYKKTSLLPYQYPDSSKLAEKFLDLFQEFGLYHE